MSLEESLASRLLAEHPDEAAAELEGLPDDSALAVVAGATPPLAAEVLSRIAPIRAARLIAALDGLAAQKVVEHLGPDRAADLARRMEGDAREHFFSDLEPGTAQLLQALIVYPDGTAGSLMDTRVLALPLDVTAAEAIEQVRQQPENIRYNLYVIDRGHRLVGVLNLRELLLAERDATLGSIARRDVLCIEGHADRSTILAHPAWREAHSLPVVDQQGLYLGAIRYRTWRRLEEQLARGRARRDSATADALGDLFSTGMEGLLGALTNIAARPIGGGADASE